MKIVIQRVLEANVVINSFIKREIGSGLLLLVGVSTGDNEKIAAFMAEKTANLRIFGDENGAMNLSLLDIGGEAMSISNFTLCADCKKGRRPSFTGACHPSVAEPLYQCFTEALKTAGVKKVVTGEFGADMKISLINDGPVTIILDSVEIMTGKGKEG